MTQTQMKVGFIICPKCKEEIPISEYTESKLQNSMYICKACKKDYERERMDKPGMRGSFADDAIILTKSFNIFLRHTTQLNQDNNQAKYQNNYIFFCHIAPQQNKQIQLIPERNIFSKKAKR